VEGSSGNADLPERRSKGHLAPARMKSTVLSATNGRRWDGKRSFLGYPITDEMSGDAGARINDFQHGSITWSAETGPIPNPQTMHFHDDVVTQDWAPIGGWIDVVVSLKGDCTFIGHMHDSGFPNIGYTLGIVVMAPSGIGYGLSHSGHVDGTITIFGRNRDDDWTDTGNNPHIADNWGDVTQARLFWRLVSSDTLSSGVQGLLEDVAKDAVKALRSGWRISADSSDLKSWVAVVNKRLRFDQSPKRGVRYNGFWCEVKSTD
jgi:hypothetical protein